MAQTLLLDQTAWDLVIDANGNIAVASEPYAIAQDVASEVRTFRNECWYDTTRGIPYFQTILGFTPSAGYMKSQFIAAAVTVPEVVSAVCYLGVANRVVTGQVQVMDSAGNTTAVTTTRTPGPQGLFAVTDTGAIGITDTGLTMVAG